MTLKLPRFNQRPAHTLLFITEVKSFRVDADRRGVLVSEVEVVEHGCKSAAGLAKVFEKIAAETAPLGRSVWLLFLRLPALLISVPTMQIKGVDQATLTQALQFEAEGMTGASSLDMQVAFSFLQAENEMSDYWLAQIEQLAWEDLLKAVKQRKCRLGGLLHPGALPLALFEAETDDWLRIEAWSNRALALHHAEGRVALQDFSFENPHWTVELEHWLEERGEAAWSEALLNNKIEMLPPTRQQLQLNENSQLTQWLSLWATVLIEQRAAGVAVLKPASSFNVELAWMIGSGLSALLLCGLHAGWFIQQRNYFEAETARLTQVEQQIAGLRKQINDKSEQQDKLQNRLSRAGANADLIPSTIQTMQQRPALLLRALAEGRQEQLIVEALSSQGSQVQVDGVTLQQQLSNQLANHLISALADSHWQVDLPVKNDMGLFDGEPGPWSFTLKLIDQGIPGFAEPGK